MSGPLVSVSSIVTTNEQYLEFASQLQEKLTDESILKTCAVSIKILSEIGCYADCKSGYDWDDPNAFPSVELFLPKLEDEVREAREDLDANPGDYGWVEVYTIKSFERALEEGKDSTAVQEIYKEFLRVEKEKLGNRALTIQKVVEENLPKKFLGDTISISLDVEVIYSYLSDPGNDQTLSFSFTG